MRFTDKVVVITGAAQGIGRQTAEQAAAEGAALLLIDRSSYVHELAATLAQSGCLVLALEADLEAWESTEQAFAAGVAHFGRIDVLINNAGLALGLDKEYEGDPEDWNTMIDTNIKGLLTMTRLIVPGMVKRNEGHVINVGSVAGDAAYAKGNVYCGTKAAVKAITDGLRIDVAETAVRVTNLKPGLVETNFSNVRFHGDNERAENVYKGITPLTGADIADVAFYAASAPKHVQIAEVLILATHQANGSTIHRQ